VKKHERCQKCGRLRARTSLKNGVCNVWQSDWRLRCGQNAPEVIITPVPDWVAPFLALYKGQLTALSQSMGLDKSGSGLQKLARGKNKWVSLHVLDPLSLAAGKELPKKWFVRTPYGPRPTLSW
jgi:hypothetical protein